MKLYKNLMLALLNKGIDSKMVIYLSCKNWAKSNKDFQPCF